MSVSFSRVMSVVSAGCAIVALSAIAAGCGGSSSSGNSDSPKAAVAKSTKTTAAAPTEKYETCDDIVFGGDGEDRASNIHAHMGATCAEAAVVVKAVKQASCSSATTQPCTYKSGEYTCVGTPDEKSAMPSSNFDCSGEGAHTVTFTKG